MPTDAGIVTRHVVEEIRSLATGGNTVPPPWYNSDPYRVHAPTTDVNKRNGVVLFECKYSEGMNSHDGELIVKLRNNAAIITGTIEQFAVALRGECTCYDYVYATRANDETRADFGIRIEVCGWCKRRKELLAAYDATPVDTLTK